MNRRSKNRGFSYIEVILASSMLVFLIGAFMGLLRTVSLSQIKNKDQAVGDKLIEMGFSRLKSIDFFYLLPMDSSQPEYGLAGTFKVFGQSAALLSSTTYYPYKTVLDDFMAQLTRAKFDRFTLEVTYMRRDRSNNNGDAVGSEDDLIPFTDNNNDRLDDYDGNVRYYDFDSDGKYFAIFLSTAAWPYNGAKTSEVPSTNIRMLKLKLYRSSSTLVAQRSTLVNIDLYSGIERISVDSLLKIDLSSPSIAGNLYSYLPGVQQTSQNYVLDTPYPASVKAFRADSGQALRFAGVTEPLATIEIGANGSGILATFVADASGNFDFSPAPVTSALIEGANTVYMVARKVSLASPIKQLSLTLDKQIPTLTKYPAASATVQDMAPLVGGQINENLTSTNVVSGICYQVNAVKIDTILYPVRTFKIADNQYFSYAIDASSLPVQLTAGSHNVEFQGSDAAKYKVKDTWSFTISIPADFTIPVVNGASPTGGATVANGKPTLQIRIQDLESGINPSSIVLNIDGTPVVSSGLGNIYKYYDPQTGYVTYTPTTSLSSGSHNFSLSGTNFAPSPLSNSGSSNFTVP